MHYVYTIQSQLERDRYYVGVTTDVNRRVDEHNDGKSIHTKKFKPWGLVGFTAFVDKSRAEAFEMYLKTASGRAFAKKRLF